MAVRVDSFAQLLSRINLCLFLWLLVFSVSSLHDVWLICGLCMWHFLVNKTNHSFELGFLLLLFHVGQGSKLDKQRL